MDLNEIRHKATALSPWAHIATVRPDGPSSPKVAFMAVQPEKALYLAAYGMGGTERWFTA